MKRPFFLLAIVLAVILLFKNPDALPADHISKISKDEPQKIFIRGIVIDDPILQEDRFGRDRERFLFRTVAARRDGEWTPSSGTVVAELVDARYNTSFGDELILEGELSNIPSLHNPHNFDYSAYMRSKDIYGMVRVKKNSQVQFVSEHKDILRAIAYHIRRRIRGSIRRYFDQESSGLLEAIMIGDRSRLSQALKESFVKTGTVHILAISGLHVGLVASIFLYIYRLLSIPRKARYLLAIPPVLLYALIAGSNPPVIRAGIVFSIFALAFLVEREVDALNSLGIAAILILICNPKALQDPSFQLSFTAILSIILLTPKLKGLVRATALAASIAATVGTAPLIAYYFNIVSPVAVIANLFIIPLLSLLMASLVVFLFLSSLLAPLAWHSALIVSWVEKLLIVVNNVFAGLPVSHVRVAAPSVLFIVLYYAVILAGISTLSLKRVLIPILLALNIFVWKDVCASGGNLLKATFLDVGHGDAAFIEFPNGSNMLIDGGSGGGGGGLDIGRSVLAPFLWNKGIRRIDAVVATHPDEDHIGGLLFVLQNFNVGLVIDNGLSKGESLVYRRYREIIKNRRLDRAAVGEGVSITGFGEGVYVLNPPLENLDRLESNDASLVIKIVFNSTTILLCADIGEEAMAHLLEHREALRSEIVKIPHHGGKVRDANINQLFMEAVNPKDSIISAGKISRLSASSRETIDVITSLNSNSYKTGTDGALTLISDGDTHRVYRYRDIAVKKNKLFYT